MNEILNFDNLSVAFWFCAYLAIIYNGIKHRKEKKIFMPPIPGAISIAWEGAAMILSQGMIGHILWFVPDILIFGINLFNFHTLGKRIIYIVSTLIIFVLFLFLFNVPGYQGMLLSSFVLDLLIAISYVTKLNQISPNGRTIIGVFRFLGDFSAFLYYMRMSVVVLIIGVVVALLNIFYLACSLELNQQQHITRKAKK